MTRTKQQPKPQPAQPPNQDLAAARGRRYCKYDPVTKTGCLASLTEVDYEIGYCSQCGQVIKPERSLEDALRESLLMVRRGKKRAA